MLFDEKHRLAAREEYKAYIDSVMSSSYGNLDVIHSCGDKKSTVQEEDDMSIDEDNAASANALQQGDASSAPQTSTPANSQFYDYKEESPKRDEQLQLIRNTRNKHRKNAIRGAILHCEDCDEMFSTQDIIGMALANHKEKKKDKSNVVLPIHDKRLDIAAYRFPYDY